MDLEGRADATSHGPGQCPQIGGALGGRAYLRPPERADGLFIRAIGIARARTKLGLANLVYNMQRAVWLTEQIAPI
jgi:hypothetical protein